MKAGHEASPVATDFPESLRPFAAFVASADFGGFDDFGDFGGFGGFPAPRLPPADDPCGAPE